MLRNVGATSVSVDAQVLDDSGQPVTGLVASTFPAVTYSVAGPNADVAVTLADLAALTTAWAAGGLKERGNGFYRLDLPNAAFAAAGEVRVRAEATGKHLLAPLVEVDATVRSRMAQGATVTFTGPLNPLTQALTLTVGCDYFAADNNAPVWSSTAWPDLTGATLVELRIFAGARTLPARWKFTGALVTVGPSTTQSVKAEPTSAWTSTLVPGTYGYGVFVTLASGRIVEIVTGDNYLNSH